ncbi:hypothetical protein ABK040_012908 [Willaertia magna]
MVLYTSSSESTSFPDRFNSRDEMLDFFLNNIQQVEDIPKRIITGNEPAVYVTQAEFAAIPKSNPHHIQFLGSEDATTCTILIFETVNYFACVHLDGHEGQLELLHSKLKSLSTNNNETIKIHMIGSYIDEENTSKKNLIQLLNFLHFKCNFKFHFGTVLVYNKNTEQTTKLIKNDEYNDNYEIDEEEEEEYEMTVNIPKCINLTIDLTTSKLYNALFKENKGPEHIVRSIVSFMGDYPLYTTYNEKEDIYLIGPTDYQPYNYRILRKDYIGSYLNLPDYFILNNFSTSPFAEPEHFVEDMKRKFKFMLEMGDDKSYFKNGLKIYKRKDKTNEWISKE